VPRAPPRLHQLAWLFVLLAVFRLIELAFLVAFALTPWSDPILLGLAWSSWILVAFDLILVVFLTVLAALLFLAHRPTFQFVLGTFRGPGALLLLLSLVSFFLGWVFLLLALASLVALIGILAILFSPATRQEVDGMDYAKADLGAVDTVLARRGFREPVRDPEEGEDRMEVEYADAKGQLCPECDGYNPDGATACRDCGASLNPGAHPPS